MKTLQSDRPALTVQEPAREPKGKGSTEPKSYAGFSPATANDDHPNLTTDWDTVK